jgi:hypothetical protein
LGFQKPPIRLRLDRPLELRIAGACAGDGGPDQAGPGFCNKLLDNAVDFSPGTPIEVEAGLTTKGSG